MLTQANCITISSLLFLISVLGIFLNQKNILIMLMSYFNCCSSRIFYWISNFSCIL